MDRAKILARVKAHSGAWDLVVIGGGAAGVGCALDAASRGFKVLLLEQHDFGKGTSSRSTKLIHGGVRYLAQGDIPLVREALKEREVLLRNAPHVVHRQEFIVPCYSLSQKFHYAVGLKIYDILAGKHGFGRSRILSRRETLKLLPNLKRNKLSGGILYYDGQFDDTRLLIDLAKTAHKHGAAVLNYAKVTEIEKDKNGKAVGVQFVDALLGENLRVETKAVINATGAFCDSVRKLGDGSAAKLVALSQGVHLVFKREFLPSDSAIVIPKTSDGRVLFCIPWHGHTLVGTTDTPIETASLEPKALESEIDFILETAAGYLAKTPTRSDVLSVFAGIRPLVKSSVTKRTSSLSRSHTIDIGTSGMLTITGGKWTTYRKMAEDAVDQTIKFAGLPATPCRTENLTIDAETENFSGERLHPDLPYHTSDIVRAVRREMAQTLEDVLARRTRALFLNAKAAMEAAAATAEIMAAEMGKDQVWTAEQLLEFNAIAQNYIASPSVTLASGRLS